MDIQKREVSLSNAKMETAFQTELNEWLTRFYTIWKQKSHELWLRDGDRNTKFFHLSTIIHRRQNSIDAIRADDGGWILDQKAVGEHLKVKFTQLFTKEEVVFLLDEDIKKVIFDMQSLKAPGPDGLPPLFYKQYWHIVGPVVTKVVKCFIVNGKLLKELNNTHIVLIPKIHNPTSVNHFKPISLCNIVYKAITKILVAKLRTVLDIIISPCQSAFVPGRWIGENQVITKELMHSFKTSKVKGGFVAMKVDLQKAYDRIN